METLKSQRCMQVHASMYGFIIREICPSIKLNQLSFIIQDLKESLNYQNIRILIFNKCSNHTFFSQHIHADKIHIHSHSQNIVKIIHWFIIVELDDITWSISKSPKALRQTGKEGRHND